MQATTVGQAVRTSLAGALDAFLSAIPRLLGFAVVLIVGWLISSLLGRGVTALLRAVRFDDLARRSGFAGFVQGMGLRTDPTGAVAAVAKWFVRLITLVVAFDLLGLPAVSGVLQQLLLWLPNLAVALVVLVVGGLAADALAALVRGGSAEAGFTNPAVLGGVTRVVVWAFAIVVAVDQLGIATALVNTLLVGVVGALALATGLAFGLGGRDRAARLLDRWGEQAARAAPRLERMAAAEEAGEPLAGAGSERLPRSGFDRRRLAREGPDRRGSEGLARG